MNHEAHFGARCSPYGVWLLALMSITLGCAPQPAPTRPPVKLSAGVALPQTGPEGTLMAFSVDYRFLDGTPNKEGQYLWIIQPAVGEPLEMPVQLKKKQDTLQTFVPQWKPNNGPFKTHIVEVADAEIVVGQEILEDHAIDGRFDLLPGRVAMLLQGEQPLGVAALEQRHVVFTVPEPTGVVALVAPDEPALDGLVSRVVPALVGGNAVVVVASEVHPLAAIELAEAVATSDVPAGVVNVLTGLRDEIAPVLAAHMDVNAIDVTGADGDVAALEVLAAENVKRVVRARDEQSPWEIGAFMELKTVWHPIGR